MWLPTMPVRKGGSRFRRTASWSVGAPMRAALMLRLGMCGVLAHGIAGADPGSVLGEKLVMGWLESVFVLPGNVRVTAKLDTGAKTSSLHASNVEHFKRSGIEWVRFNFVPDKGAEPIRMERPLIRTAIIKERQAHSSERDVVRLEICKNGKNYETEFTLYDRSNFNYPILLGRSFLQDVALVDASETFLFKAETDPCAKAVVEPSPKS